MTFRAILIGLIGAVALATLGYVNNQALELPSLVTGHQLPIAVIGTLTVVMVTVNPLLWWIRRSWSFRPAELAVVVMLLMISCSIPGRGLLENMIPSLSLPVHYYGIDAGWRRNRVLTYAPRSMILPVPSAAGASDATTTLADEETDRKAVSWLVSGAGQKGHWLSLDEVPWKPWIGPLVFWSPMLALMTVAVICLSLVLHRQWTAHERLRYPIADFATTLMSRPEGSAVPPVFRNKIFWIGLGVVTAIHVLNGLNQWYGGKLVEVPLNFSFATAIKAKWPSLEKFPWFAQLASLRLFPVVIGFSYFLASEVSLSLGLSQLLFFVPFLILITYGVDMSSDYVGGGAGGWQRFGSYVALAMIMLYTGRRYYWGVLKSALTFRRDADIPSGTAWVCRLLMMSVAGMIVLVVSQGLAWPLAILTFLLIFVMLVSATRINAETGLFFVQPRWQPLGVLIGFFGGYALGPEAMVIIGLLGMMLCLDVSQALMPYLINGLRICENLGVRPSRVAAPAGVVYGAAVAIGIVVAMWTSYNFGFKLDWSKNRAPKDSFVVINRALTDVRVAGELEESRTLGALQRLAAFRPQKKFLVAAGIGLGLVLVVGMLRLRLPWWPLHPVIFLVWDTHPMSQFSSSFLIGWMVKVAVTRLGGPRTYNKAKPLMTGLIAGELLGVLIWMVVATVTYLATGLVPTEAQNYKFLPR